MLIKGRTYPLADLASIGSMERDSKIAGRSGKMKRQEDDTSMLEAEESTDWMTPSGSAAIDPVASGPAMADTASAVIAPTDTPATMAAAATPIEWLNPTAGTSLTPGQSILATWRGYDPAIAPSFALCTQEGNCGDASWPKVVSNDDGTASAHLSLPQMQEMVGLYLKMSNGADAISSSTSPTFNVAAVQVPDAADAGTTGVNGASVNPYFFGSTGAYPSATKKNQASETNKEIPTAYPTNQYPFIASMSGTLTNAPSGMISGSSPALLPVLTPGAAGATAESHASSRPSATAIAVPLAVCGLIGLAAVMFCLRSMYMRKKAQSAPAAPDNFDPEKDWQSMLKAKTADSLSSNSLHKAASITGDGYTITQRHDGERSDFHMSPALGYMRGGSSRSARDGERHREEARDERERFDARDSREMHDRRSEYSRGGESRRYLTPTRVRETFTSIPIRWTRGSRDDNYSQSSRKRLDDEESIYPRGRGRAYSDDRDRRSYRRGEEEDRYSRSSRHSADRIDYLPRIRRDPAFLDDHHVRQYYATSRKSASSVGGCSCSRSHHSRSDRETRSDRRSSSSSGTRHAPMSRGSTDLPTIVESRGSPFEDVVPRCERGLSNGSTCSSATLSTMRQDSIVNPHPRSPTSGRSYAGSTYHSRSSRPLPPQPMIRGYDSDGVHYARASRSSEGHGSRWALPHESGVLERAPSSSSTNTHPGWDNVNYDKKSYAQDQSSYYPDHETIKESARRSDLETGLSTADDPNMEGLYESLRRAIGTPRM